jgi:glycosyltransferase involved in cell wall biosynthesis
VVHDADYHPGDGYPFQMTLQRRLAARATGLVALSSHVAARLRERGELGAKRLILSSHPPFTFGPPPPPPRSHGGRLRLLFFGRLLPYKGLDLFVAALHRLGPRDDIEIRVAGLGPDSVALTALRAMPHVTVDQRWIPEDEVAAILAWSDALVLSHREASQSGVAATAIAARRWVVATNVGGLVEQLAQEPLARLCPPTPEALAAAIQGLIESPPTGEAGNPGYTWAIFAKSLVSEIKAARVTPATPMAAPPRAP